MTSRISHIEIDDAGPATTDPDIEREWQVAVDDLLEENTFALLPREGQDAPAGPYRLRLAIQDGRLVFVVFCEDDSPAREFHLSLGPFRQVVKDYFRICESYYDAVKSLSSRRVEAIDMARRGIHDEGASILQERLEDKASLDKDTARRLFTLICALQRG